MVKSPSNGLKTDMKYAGVRVTAVRHVFHIMSPLPL